MTRTTLAVAALLLGFAAPALASYVPIKYQATRDVVAARCESLGSNGEGWGLDRQDGAYGCRNLTNGGAISCTGDGRCTDYSGDPRWLKIRQLFDKANKQPPFNRPAQAV